MWELQKRGSAVVLEAAIALLTQPEDPWRRSQGATILAQLGAGTDPFPEQRFAALTAQLAHEIDSRVQEAIAFGLTHLDNPRCQATFLKLAQSDNPELRLAAAVGMKPRWGPEATVSLLALTQDSEAEVRNWATFAFVQDPTDSAEIRAALVERLTDSCDEVSFEAICALARRRDRACLEGMLADFGPHMEEAGNQLLGLALEEELHGEELLARLRAFQDDQL